MTEGERHERAGASAATCFAAGVAVGFHLVAWLSYLQHLLPAAETIRLAVQEVSSAGGFRPIKSNNVGRSDKDTT